MTIAEKILALRTEQGLSQGDLAEKLEVSRQSVSKWETGQATPDLDKIIKLADLFGVTVDELVREEERPEPPKAEPRVVYIEREKQGLRPAQILGMVAEVLGAALFLLGLMTGGGLCLVGLSFILLGLPLLLARKHPFLICGWIIAGVCYAIFNPYITATPWGLLGAMKRLAVALAHPEYHLLGRGTSIGVAIAIVRGLLTLFLLVCTLRAWRKSKR